MGSWRPPAVLAGARPHAPPEPASVRGRLTPWWPSGEGARRACESASSSSSIIALATPISEGRGGSQCVVSVAIIAPKGSREAAYTYAVTSAGVTHSVTTACSRGNISTFGCDDRRRGRYSSSGWKWGGCSADIRFGVRFAKKFLDAREVEGGGRALMNLHNNRAGRRVSVRAGRRAVRSGMRTECKCHGVSGSCTVKTCWKTLPPFTFIGRHLFHKYRKAKSVSVHKGRRRSTPHLRLERVRRRARRPRKFHLVYLERSPNYCQMNPAVGSLGTVGRKCNRTSSGPGGCDLLCCGRGYNTHQYTRTWHCNCKFHWCCYVQCHTCMEDTEENNCK
ncbi:protein Wnt-7b-like [Eriocheir sinensis]|uniref:protein Wnt-7b-like n=1 Tax=Eriocheir sinensis TaxID=95602 RepID=UPI0021C5CAA3|nr:protein Wnt-7b-like [Eriocheir sinensis]